MLEVRNLSKSFGGVAAISDVSLTFPSSSLTAIIGPNGAGKSTFFNLISGGLRPDAGQVALDGTQLVGRSRAAFIRAGIGRAFQVAKIFPSLTVEETLLAAVAAHEGQSTHLRHRFPLPKMRARVTEVAEMLGLPDRLEMLSANLSHGDQKLLDVALALVLEPRRDVPVVRRVVGGSIAAGGIALATWSSMEFLAANEAYGRFLVEPDNDAAQAMYTAEVQPHQVSAWVAAGAGVAALATGGALFFIPSPQGATFGATGTF